jgi:cellulose biosynthesis protein BcsE
MPTAPFSLRISSPRSVLLRALVHRLRPSSLTAAGGTATTPTRIGLEGLSNGVNELPRQVPVALVTADESSTALWFPALLEDAVAAGPVALVASSAEWADELLLRQPLRDAYRSGKLLLWVLSPGLQAQVKRHGLGLLMNELERTGLKKQHALYVCDAQPLLSGLSVAQLARLGDQLSTLCQERRRPVVLGFFAHPEMDMLLPTLRNLCHRSMHIATLHTDADRWSLGLERWNSAAGAVFQTAFGLVHDTTSGRLTADGTRTRGTANELVEAVDQSDVIATRAAVARQRGVPSHWRIVDTLADIEAAAASSVAATVLVDAGEAADFEALARLVHRLRLSRPLTLKIVVRENLDKLRMHSEQALLQLGASAVVYKEVGFSRLLQLLTDINAQSHTREVDPDYGQAVEGFLPPDVRGYQLPAQFCRLVRDVLNRTQNMGLSHSLVQLSMLAQTPHLDALRACHMSRNGDLLTADHEAVYVFLFACREPDVEQALNRLFTVPLTQLFASETIDCSDTGIRTMTDHLQDSARKGSPDYSALLNSSLLSLSSPISLRQVAVAPTPIAVASAHSAATWPVRTPAPTDPAEPLGTHALRSATGPSVQPRPIARRAMPQPAHRSRA